MQVEQLDALGTSSSLVPLGARPALSGREFLHEIARQSPKHSDHSRTQERMQLERSTPNRGKVMQQADHFLETKKKHTEQSQNILLGSQTTQNITKTHNLQFSPRGEKRSVAIHDKLVPKITSRSSGPQIMMRFERSRSRQTSKLTEKEGRGRAAKVSVINVQVQFEKELSPDAAFGQRLKSYGHCAGGRSGSAQDIDTLQRNSQVNLEDKEARTQPRHQKFLNALSSTAQVHAQRSLHGQRSQSSITSRSRKRPRVAQKQWPSPGKPGYIKQKDGADTYREADNSPMTLVEHQYRGSEYSSTGARSRSVTPNHIKYQDASHEQNHLEQGHHEMNHITADGFIYPMLDEEADLGGGGQDGRGSDMDARSIMVRVGSPVKLHPDGALRSNLFSKGLASEWHRKEVKPIHQYAYDRSGSLINQHRQRKDPTVATRIRQSELDLSKQIESQRAYLIQVMRGRLPTTEHVTAERQENADGPTAQKRSTAAGQYHLRSPKGRAAVDSPLHPSGPAGDFDAEVQPDSNLQGLVTKSLIDGFFKRMNWKQDSLALDRQKAMYPNLAGHLETRSSSSGSRRGGSTSPPKGPTDGTQGTKRMSFKRHNRPENSNADGPLSHGRQREPAVKRLNMEVVHQSVQPEGCLSPQTMTLSDLPKNGDLNRASQDTETAKLEVMNQIQAFELIGQQMFGVTQQQPIRITKLAGPPAGDPPKPKRKQTRPKYSEVKSRKSSNASGASPALQQRGNSDLDGEIDGSFGGQALGARTKTHKSSVSKSKQALKTPGNDQHQQPGGVKIYNNPALRAHSFKVQKIAPSRQTPDKYPGQPQEASVIHEISQQESFGHYPEHDMHKTANTSSLLMHKEISIESQAELEKPGSLSSEITQLQLKQALSVPFEKSRDQQPKLARQKDVDNLGGETVGDDRQVVVPKVPTEQSGDHRPAALPSSNVQPKRPVDATSTSTLHKMSAMSISKNDAAQLYKQATELHSPFKPSTTGTHSLSLVNGAKYNHGAATPPEASQPDSAREVRANSLFPNFLSFFVLDQTKSGIQICTVSIQQLLYEQKNDELTSKQFQQACLAYCQRMFLPLTASMEALKSPKGALLKYLYDQRGHQVDSILDWIQENNSEQRDTLIFQVSPTRLTNKQLSRNNSLLKQSTGELQAPKPKPQKKPGNRSPIPIRSNIDNTSRSSSNYKQSLTRLFVEGKSPQTTVVSRKPSNWRHVTQPKRVPIAADLNGGYGGYLLSTAKRVRASPGRSPRRSPQLSNDLVELNQSGEWAQQSIEDSLFSRDNLMKSNFKQNQTRKTEEDELYSPVDSATRLQPSQDLIDGQKATHFAPQTAHRPQPTEQFAEIAEYPQTSKTNREHKVTSGAMYIVQSTDGTNHPRSRKPSRASQASQGSQTALEEAEVNLPFLIAQQQQLRLPQGSNSKSQFGRQSNASQVTQQNASNFHDYVCSTLLMQAEETEKQRQRRMAEMDAERDSAEHPISEADKNKYLERFYKNSIQQQAFRNSTGFASSLIAHNPATALSKNDSLLQEALLQDRLPTVGSGATSSRFNRLNLTQRSFLPQTENSMNSNIHTAAQTFRHSTLSHPMTRQSTSLVNKSRANAKQDFNFNRTWMAMSQISQSTATERAPRVSQAIAPMKQTFSQLMNPQVSGMRKLSTSQQPRFIPTKMIRIAHREKTTEDLPRMKNLFLANCLKIRTNEMNRAERTQSKMAHRVRRDAKAFNDS